MRVLSQALVLTAAATATASAPAASEDAWQSIRGGLDAWAKLQFDANFAVNAGTEDGQVFLYSPDDLSMFKPLEGASLSKWPAAIMISGLVNDGVMSFTDKANKYLDFWATDPADPRSEVTLESLLSFTSGFLEDVPALYECKENDFVKCAELAYNESKAYTKPRKEFKYLSCHLQFAAAMAVEASKTNIQELFDKYLYKRFNMTHTGWYPETVPSIAGGIVTVGHDFQNLLHGMLTYNGISKETLDVVETDWTKAPVSPSGDGWFGHYGFGHWWECIGYGTPSERNPLSETCNATKIQAGPGEFGYYPLLDRSGGTGAAGVKRPPYYFQVILQEPDPLSGIPEYLRIITKPLADIALSGVDPSTHSKQELLDAGAGILRRDIVYIESELKTCTCSEVPTAKGEPFASLIKNLPEDEPKKNRQEILSSGGGLTLFEVAEIQKTLGTCKCTGREHPHLKN